MSVTRMQAAFLPGSRVADAHDQADFTSDFESMPGELGVKAICLDDRNMSVLRDRLDRLFPGISHQECADETSFAFKAAGSPFEVVIFHGEDEKRMARIMQGHSLLLRSKAKIAFLSESEAPGRAGLLRAGFDDVFDKAMADYEIKLRIMAIVRRINIRLHSQAENSQLVNWSLIRQWTVDRLTEREAVIFTVLFKNYGKIVDYKSILKCCILNRPLSNRKTLSVTICKMRKKLKKEVAITSFYGEGYQLLIS